MNDSSRQPDSPATPTERADALARTLLADIPMARAMGLSVARYSDGALTLAAPLAPNINDKGCAFGGSLGNLMTLAGWGLVKLAVDERGIDADIYVKDSTIRYLAPVWQDFAALARLADGESIADFLDELTGRGKARIGVRCSVPLADGSEAATLDARFVALCKR